MTSAVLLVRHGTTALNTAGALRGRVDVPLTPAGMAEARALGRRLAHRRLDTILASPLRRAVQTARAVAEPHGLEVGIDPRLIDLDYGRWAGVPPGDLSREDRALFAEWERDPSRPLPGAEDPGTAQERALASLEELAAGGSGCAVLVAHDAILQLVLGRILDLPLQTYRGLRFEPASLSELERQRGRWRVRLLNSAWHLANACGSEHGPALAP